MPSFCGCHCPPPLLTAPRLHPLIGTPFGLLPESVCPKELLSLTSDKQGNVSTSQSQMDDHGAAPRMDRKQKRGCRGPGEEVGGDFAGAEVPFCKATGVPWTDRGDGCVTTCVSLTPLDCPLEKKQCAEDDPIQRSPFTNETAEARERGHVCPRRPLSSEPPAKG